MKAIVNGGNFDLCGDLSAVSLLFAAGMRPDASAIRALARNDGNFSVSLEPAEVSSEEAAWVELLANGLTFDVTGLNPGPAAAQPEREHLFGLSEAADLAAWEAITITPGAHLAGGKTMFAVLRTLAWLGALLADLPHLQAIVWHPARAWNAPNYYRSGVQRWIEGGVFPGLGLTAISPTGGGGLVSEGLAVFIGQELVVSPELVSDRSEGTKFAMRLVNWLIENGRITESTSMIGPSGETLRLISDQNQQIVKVTASS